jgi:signal transduction histidine kinase
MHYGLDGGAAPRRPCRRMSTAPSGAAPDLVREAQRLRFSDAALEARFRDERLATGEVRVRVMALVAVLIVAFNGWNDARALARAQPAFVAEDLQLRFLIMIPAFLAIALSPALARHRRRADWVNVGGVVIACWANALIFWRYSLVNPNAAIAGQILGSVMPILVISVFGLPIGFRGALAMIGLTAAGIVGWFAAVLAPGQSRSAVVLATTLPTVGGAAALLGWWRERGERTMFAQREQVRRLADELARVNAEQAAFMGIAAHDLRAPLATVRGYAELLHKGRLPEGEARQNALGEIEAQSARMLALVSDYLGAHAAAGRAEPAKLARVDLGATARAAVVRHQPAAAAKGQTLASVDAPARWAQADEARLAQIVDNFVVNALKFSPRGATVRVAVEARGAGLRLAVSDDGPGIAAEEQAGLFRMFGRGTAQPTGGEASHGFGLAVAKRLAHSMGGAVGCQSEVKRGATFWIELPPAT